jgi:CrcB protein
MMWEVLAVMLGGALGSFARFMTQRWVQSLPLEGGFPYGVMVANIVGSFVIGFLAALLVGKWELHAAYRAGIFVGLLGGFTTFSSFSLDTVKLIEAGQYVFASVNVLVSVAACLLATTLGLMLGRSL